MKKNDSTFKAFYILFCMIALVIPAEGVNTSTLNPGSLPSGTMICKGNWFTTSGAVTASGNSCSPVMYQWQSSTVSASAGFSNIAGATGVNLPMTGPIMMTTYFRRGAYTSCDTLVYTNVMTVSLYPEPPILCSSPGTNLCSGASATLTCTGGVVFSDGSMAQTWMPGVSSGSILIVNINSTTTYTVSGLDYNGCMFTSTLTLTVSSAPAIPVSGGNATLCPGASHTLICNGASSYTWMPGSITGSMISVTPSISTVYSVSGISTNNCVGTSTASLVVSICTGIEAAHKMEEISVYPNPNNGEFVLKYHTSGANFTIDVFDPQGKFVFSKTSVEDIERVDLKNNPPGLYLLRIYESDGTHGIKKIMKQ